jgi:hypothetical protein
VLWRLLADPVLPLDYSAWAARLSAELQGLARQIGDRLSLAPVIDAAREVGEAVTAARALSPAKANAALMQVSRVLVPLHTGVGGRFAHDPALPQPPWPALAALREFAAAAPGSDEARFAAVAARRARNLLMHALEKAHRVLNAARGSYRS